MDAVPGDGTAVPPPADGTTPDAPPRTPWLVLDVVRELRWMLRMLTDYRYRMSWSGRLVLFGALLVGVLSWFLLSGLPLVGGILDRVVLIFAAVVTYRAMSREVCRYQELMARVYRFR